MISIHFWTGVFIGTLAALLIIGYCLLTRRKSKLQFVVIIGVIALYILIGWAIYIPASVAIQIASNPTNYPEGESVYGVRWREYYYELSLLIDNNSESDMNNIDINIATDLLIAGAGVSQGINNCTHEPINPFGRMTIKYRETERPGTDRNYQLVMSSLYRIRCDRFLSKSSLEIKMPIASQEWAVSREKKPPQWAKLWISMMAGLRPVNWEVIKCFMNKCGRIPEYISQVPFDMSISPLDGDGPFIRVPDK